MFKVSDSMWLLKKAPLTSSSRMMQAVSSLSKSELKSRVLVEAAKKSIVCIRLVNCLVIDLRAAEDIQTGCSRPTSLATCVR